MSKNIQIVNDVLMVTYCNVKYTRFADNESKLVTERIRSPLKFIKCYFFDPIECVFINHCSLWLLNHISNQWLMNLFVNIVNKPNSIDFLVISKFFILGLYTYTFSDFFTYTGLSDPLEYRLVLFGHSLL